MLGKRIKLISLLLTLVMLLGVFASCGSSTSVNEATTNADESELKTDDNSETETKKEQSEGSETESESESKSDPEDESESATASPTLEGENAELIVKSYELMNGVNTYYSGGDRDSVMIDNKVMNLSYNIKSNSNNMQIGYLSTPDGKPYITDTMDVFVKMKDGNVYYSSKSISEATLNIYRYGYY